MADIRFEQWPEWKERGGQHVGTGPSGIKGTLMVDGELTGIEACCSLHRSQFKNRQAVVEMIEWALASANMRLPDS